MRGARTDETDRICREAWEHATYAYVTGAIFLARSQYQGRLLRAMAFVGIGSSRLSLRAKPEANMKSHGLAVLALALLAAPLVAELQMVARPGKVAMIGILTMAWSAWFDYTEGFRDGLNELGYIEGQTRFVTSAVQASPSYSQESATRYSSASQRALLDRVGTSRESVASGPS